MRRTRWVLTTLALVAAVLAQTSLIDLTNLYFISPQVSVTPQSRLINPQTLDVSKLSVSNDVWLTVSLNYNENTGGWSVSEASTTSSIDLQDSLGNVLAALTGNVAELKATSITLQSTVNVINITSSSIATENKQVYTFQGTASVDVTNNTKIYIAEYDGTACYVLPITYTGTVVRYELQSNDALKFTPPVSFSSSNNMLEAAISVGSTASATSVKCTDNAGNTYTLDLYQVTDTNKKPIIIVSGGQEYKLYIGVDSGSAAPSITNAIINVTIQSIVDKYVKLSSTVLGSAEKYLNLSTPEIAFFGSKDTPLSASDDLFSYSISNLNITLTNVKLNTVTIDATSTGWYTFPNGAKVYLMFKPVEVKWMDEVIGELTTDQTNEFPVELTATINTGPYGSINVTDPSVSANFESIEFNNNNGALEVASAEPNPTTDVKIYAREVTIPITTTTTTSTTIQLTTTSTTIQLTTTKTAVTLTYTMVEPTIATTTSTTTATKTVTTSSGVPAPALLAIFGWFAKKKKK